MGEENTMIKTVKNVIKTTVPPHKKVKISQNVLQTKAQIPWSATMFTDQGNSDSIVGVWSGTIVSDVTYTVEQVLDLSVLL